MRPFLNRNCDGLGGVSSPGPGRRRDGKTNLAVRRLGRFTTGGSESPDVFDLRDVLGNDTVKPLGQWSISESGDCVPPRVGCGLMTKLAEACR